MNNQDIDNQIVSVSLLAEWAHSTSISKGFYAKEPSVADKIALMHSELSELLEAYRSGEAGAPNDKGVRVQDGDRITAAEEEVADLIIRALDFAAWQKMRIGQAVVAKMAYNERRPHLHGKKF